MCTCFVICPRVSCCSCHIFHLCCCYSSGVPCLIVQVSLPYNKTGRASALYNFILAFLRVFCGLNTLFKIPVIFIYKIRENICAIYHFNNTPSLQTFRHIFIAHHYTTFILFLSFNLHYIMTQKLPKICISVYIQRNKLVHQAVV